MDLKITLETKAIQNKSPANSAARHGGSSWLPSKSYWRGGALCTKSKRDWDPTTLLKELSQLEADPAPTDNLHLRGRKVFPQNSNSTTASPPAWSFTS